QSIFNQKNSTNFKCIVACNDIPELFKEYDERLEFIKMDLPVPTEWIEMARDKFWKLTKIAVRCRQLLEEQEEPENGIYVMPVDADDLLSNKIAEYCETHPDENGFVSSDGYDKYDDENKLHVYKNLHTFCGSCNIIKMYREDLPEKMPYSDEFCHDKEIAGILNKKYPIRYDHNVVVDRYDSMGKTFAKLPFRSTIYCLGNGDNISSIYHSTYSQVDNRRFHSIALVRNILEIRCWRRISRRIQIEFSIKE
ncbi:MAG: hypothetical protein Q4D29_12090, partial [Lachnospiraceae bacterium]|nr:hypothetical protein [Lachnospiraceae bacterium]